VADGEASSIDGDQTTRCVFFLKHPLLANCDREMAFTCTGGDWRADG
jgi:hypothetical protein